MHLPDRKGALYYMYHRIDMNAYPRKEHFEHFASMPYPFITVTNETDITAFLRETKEKGLPFFLTLQYAAARAANRIPEFRRRIDGNGIIEYDSCAVSWIVLQENGTYRYAYAETEQPFEAYLSQARASQKAAETDAVLPETDDLAGCFYFSCVPWFGFTGLSMPVNGNRFSIPSFVFGKYRKELKPLPAGDGSVRFEEKTFLPLALMVNHALMDGLHLGRFFEEFDKVLAEPLP